MIETAAAAYAGRRVLVTGATGFIGSHLIRAIAAAGADTHAVVRPGREQALPVGVDLHAHACDLLDASGVAAVVAAVDPQQVFHLAAYGTTGLQSDRGRIERVNIAGTTHLWDALGSRVCRFVQTGSCGEYGDVRGPIAESHACQPRWLYPATVHAAVTISQARGHESGREVVILRPFGPYGPGDRPERLIPYVIARLLAGERAEVSPGTQLRDYSHVDDHVTAILLAGARPLRSRVAVYNVASGRPITVRTLLETIAQEIGGDAPQRLIFGARPLGAHEPAEMYADVSAIGRDLGFRADVELRDGLRRTIAAARAALLPNAGVSR
jgi:UDP-glucose 4-epimerase